MNEEQLVTELNSNPLAVENALQVLEEIHLISRTDESPARFLPTSSVSDCTLVDIWRTLRNHNADRQSEESDSSELAQINAFQAELDAAVERELGSRKFIEPADKLVAESASITPIDVGIKNAD